MTTLACRTSLLNFISPRGPGELQHFRKRNLTCHQEKKKKPLYKQGKREKKQKNPRISKQTKPWSLGSFECMFCVHKRRANRTDGENDKENKLGNWRHGRGKCWYSMRRKGGERHHQWLERSFCLALQEDLEQEGKPIMDRRCKGVVKFVSGTCRGVSIESSKIIKTRYSRREPPWYPQ